MKLNPETTRVFARNGARELTQEEVARVSGGVGTFSATTNLSTALPWGGLGDVPEHDDIP